MKVECPVCGLKIQEQLINEHLDKNCQPSKKTKFVPLAERLRPQTREDFKSQSEQIQMLFELAQTQQMGSLILWGPPGVGKTTLARILGRLHGTPFLEFSGARDHLDDMRKQLFGKRNPVVFVDEIHRFTKAQQDFFLHGMEKGDFFLIGCTTENPSFRINNAILSRSKVFLLDKLNEEDLASILSKGHMIKSNTPGDPELMHLLAQWSDGDARVGLTTLEMAMNTCDLQSKPLDKQALLNAFQKQANYDRNGDNHYEAISALHKSMRGSDKNASLYWLGRMIYCGEDPLYVARRLVRFASEDIGLADPQALPLAMACYQACHTIGMPECDVILGHTVCYLADAKKSVEAYKAMKQVKQFIENNPQYPVPLHIRNAPTQLLQDLGYGKGYKYNPDHQEPVDQTYLPPEMQDVNFFT
ncbi:DNA polymerase III, clamp loader complex, gamma/delta/delta subunit [Gorgonomyces haynaldii]|nr:DNA polymerase III, clamp loader complex, gamma/delta/delta subunit [Gorgonomyces haynaldii]